MPFVVSARGNRFLKMATAANQFANRVATYEGEAATEATAESKVIYQRWHSGRPLAPARKGRPTTGGTFADLLLWQRTGSGMVEFDLAGLESRAPYAIIQEIGTGQSATVLGGGGSYSVSSQVGRRISPHLYWADSAGGAASRPLTARNRAAQRSSGAIGMQQLFERPPGQFGRAGRIRREIKGKHFIRDGGLAGYDLLRDRLEVDFKKTFR
ncbi:MAG TPA: hypothetical protein VFH56_02675 [Acidimicrobiales bacterium]|nr:hypothetical protein [Acidimicrobiales bacterium]